MPSRRGAALAAAIAIVTAIGGGMAAIHYHHLGLTLSHYDSRGHLIVARRIFDSITPGWQQIGAVWLPLPHLLNAIPVQIDLFYRTGASAVAISILAFAVATAAIAWIVHALTGSRVAAVAGAAVFALNPNVLYLQATPMTEPLLLALTTLAVALLIAWCREVTARPASALVGWIFALACLTRFEAWPVTACALVAAVWALWRNGERMEFAVRRVGAIAVYPAVAVLGFLVFSRVVVGQWFVSSGFFVPENKALGDGVMAAAEIGWGTNMLSGSTLFAAGVLGIAALVVVALFSRRQATALVALSLIATASLPWAAFVKGHPFRIRYMVPLIAMEAVGAGAAVGLVRRARFALAIVLFGLIAYELRPLDANAPMVVEAQWDRPNAPLRKHVTECIGAPGRGKIMASMGSLGHYMQEASLSGFQIRDFLHEGNGDIWLEALGAGPRPFVEWILIEEKAQGGDMLARRVREYPNFLDGYSRICEGAGLALYRRDDLQNITFNVNR
jgi:hypothetical protein